MNSLDQLKSGLTQILFVLVVALIFWLFNRFLKKEKVSIITYLKLKLQHTQFDNLFFASSILLIIYAVTSTVIQFHYSDQMRQLLTSDNSPYAKALFNGLTLNAFLSGFIYSFVNSSGAEELLFRGLIAPRLINKFGFKLGNILQSLVFWIMHLLLFKLITGYWFSWLQAFAFVTSFLMGLFVCHMNYRKSVVSIWPSWLLHGLANFSTFITLSYLL